MKISFISFLILHVGLGLLFIVPIFIGNKKDKIN